MVSKVFMICDAYESGYGKGLDLSDFKDGLHIAEDYLREAYVIGYKAGEGNGKETGERENDAPHT